MADLTLSRLSDDDARALLTSATLGHLDDQVRERLVAETRGNPLALLEFAGGMSEAELSGGFATPGMALAAGSLEYRYLQRVRALPEPTQRLLLIAAADATGDPTLLWRPPRCLGVGHDAAEPALTEQLLDIGSGVRFRHPLMRAAAYAAGSTEDRQAAHRALAEVLDPVADPDRRTWHLACAATGPDEVLASELERSAERARARAGLAAAAAFLQRAVALTPDPARRAGRALEAAHAHLHAGQFDAGLGALAEAEADAVNDLQLARVEQLRADINRSSTSGREAPQLLLRAARRLESLDATRARSTYLEAWGAALVAGPLAVSGADLIRRYPRLGVPRSATPPPPIATHRQPARRRSPPSSSTPLPEAVPKAARRRSPRSATTNRRGMAPPRRPGVERGARPVGLRSVGRLQRQTSRAGAYLGRPGTSRHRSQRAAGGGLVRRRRRVVAVTGGHRGGRQTGHTDASRLLR